MAYADIKLGYTCNNNCIHCVITDQKEHALKNRGNQDRSTEEYKKELYDSMSNGCRAVTFTGGEPTIRKDLQELLAYAKSLGYIINMQTNGRAFHSKAFAKGMAPFDIHYTIALHGHNEKLHDHITRAKDSFNQTVKGIKNLAELKQEIFGKTVISKFNYKYLASLIFQFTN
jgi:MoaA/NifB/PqqE/SkfB family radical SAM enzyme